MNPLGLCQRTEHLTYLASCSSEGTRSPPARGQCDLSSSGSTPYPCQCKEIHILRNSLMVTSDKVHRSRHTTKATCPEGYPIERDERRPWCLPLASSRDFTEDTGILWYLYAAPSELGNKPAYGQGSLVGQFANACVWCFLTADGWVDLESHRCESKEGC